MSSRTPDTLLSPPPRPRSTGFGPLRALRRACRTPKGLMVLILLASLALAARRERIGDIAPGLLAAILSAALLDTALLWLTRGKVQWPSGAILSALFVALILDPRTPAYVLACTAIAAVNFKYLFRTRRANIFNPAALALVVNYVLFASGQSWWGALPDLPPPFVLLLLAAAALIARQIKKVPMVIAFLGGYFVLFTIAAFVLDPARVAEVFRVPDANAALFFAGFMLTDPPTSPVKTRDQLLYGVIVALASVAFFLLFGALWFLPGGLLVGNLWVALQRALAHRRQRRATIGGDPRRAGATDDLSRAATSMDR
jgi:Na+-translocating ferredoxin:NAD+ oxidoreductase RnfD subunit